MSCSREQELTAYVDGELSTPQRESLGAHLTVCASCRATMAALEQAISRLRTLPEFAPSPQLRRELLRRLDQDPTKLVERLRRIFRPKVLMPSLGLVTAALIAAVVARGRGAARMDPGQLELAANLELVDDYEVIGIGSLEDLEVVQHLRELESQP